MSAIGTELVIEGPLSVLRQIGRLGPVELNEITADYHLRAVLAGRCARLARNAYQRQDRIALNEVHATLAMIYDWDFSVVKAAEVDVERQPIVRDVAALMEKAMLEHETSRVPVGMIEGYPHDGAEFVRWLKAQIREHGASRHALYDQHLADAATPEDLRLLMAQESTLDPRFDDILAVMQVGCSGREKMEIAANYWDEMGNGDPALVHTTLFAGTLSAIGADTDYVRSVVTLESTISGNLSACLALNRRHYYKAVGYFGVTEYLAPRRFRRVVDAWRRLGLPEVGITYHDLHIGIDAGHAAGWFKNVVRPLVDADPRVGRDIALGAQIRLNTSQDYLDVLLPRMHTPASGEPVPMPG